jgi:hypothetical protein
MNAGNGGEDLFCKKSRTGAELENAKVPVPEQAHLGNEFLKKMLSPRTREHG